MATSPLPSGSTAFRPVALNADGALSLARIVASFSAPITEEHAFAVIHQSAAALRRLVCGGSRAASVERKTAQAQSSQLLVPVSTADIMLHRDGRVHESTFTAPWGEEQTSDAHGKTGTFKPSARKTCSRYCLAAAIVP